MNKSTPTVSAQCNETHFKAQLRLFPPKSLPHPCRDSGWPADEPVLLLVRLGHCDGLEQQGAGRMGRTLHPELPGSEWAQAAQQPGLACAWAELCWPTASSQSGGSQKRMVSIKMLSARFELAIFRVSGERINQLSHESEPHYWLTCLYAIA